jgi:RNA polymerase sigma-70 factor (ECF subfamily)
MDTDEALFVRVRGGDARAFDALYDRLAPPLFGFARARLGSEAEAEEVLQEAFVAIFRERQDADTMRSVRAWLMTTAGHLCLNRLRSRKRSGRALLAIAHDAEDAHPPSAELCALADERSRVLDRAVAGLPQVLAELYHLRTAGLSYEELAFALHVPLGTIKSRMQRLVEVLRAEVSR